MLTPSDDVADADDDVADAVDSADDGGYDSDRSDRSDRAAAAAINPMSRSTFTHRGPRKRKRLQTVCRSSSFLPW